MSYLSDPINAKLILEIKESEQATASQLLEKLSDIPQATLYRRLQKMLSDGVLKVVEENRIRGTVERVYSCIRRFQRDTKTLPSHFACAGFPSAV